MILPVTSNPALQITPAVGSAASSAASGQFGKVLESTISSLETMNQNAASSIQSFLTGENEDIHSTVLATQKAEMAFDLGLQVRNKVVSAYQEIMRMQM